MIATAKSAVGGTPADSSGKKPSRSDQKIREAEKIWEDGVTCGDRHHVNVRGKNRVVSAYKPIGFPQVVQQL